MMKAYIALFFVILPIASFGASSVRMLGAQPAAVAAVSASGAKVTPVKSSEGIGASGARIGSLRAKTSNVVSASNVNSSSRFPVITPAHSYSGVATPQTGGVAVTPKPADIDVDAIVDAVAQRFEDEYYDKNEVYSNNDFKGAVRDIEDPRFDAIRVRTSAQGSPSSYWNSRGLDLPSDDYVYIWIEEN